MIDLHTHTFLSDGLLIPSELVYSAKVKGYEAIAITDHADYANYDQAIFATQKIQDVLSEEYAIKVLSGVEISYVPANYINDLVIKCRKLGAEIIVVHGETISETVPPKTNFKAIEACVDILAHPGWITEEEVLLAKKNNVALEITTRLGHSSTNGHVAKLAKKFGAKLVLNNDVHHPNDISDYQKLLDTCYKAGLNEEDYLQMLENSREIIKRCQRGNIHVK